MSYRVCNGYVSLPSRYGTTGNSQYHVDSGRISPCWSYKDLGSSRHGLELSKSPVLSDLEKNIETAVNLESSFLPGQWKDYSRSSVSPHHSERARSTSPMRGIHSLECSRIQSTPPISRRNSLSRLPTSSSEDFSLELPLSRRGWSGSELDLKASLTESAQKRADLVQRLKDAQVKLEGQSEELRHRDKELEFSRAKIELLAVKQKQLETSISQLEKEKGWLEVSRYEDKRQRGELQDRIINLEMEVMKTKSNLENLNYTSVLKYQKTPMDLKENDELSRELRTARENLLYLRNRVKVLDAEKTQSVEELRILREGSQQAFSQTNDANQRVTDTLRAQKDLQEELANLQLNLNTTSLEKELVSSKIMRLEEKVKDLNLRLNIAHSDRERVLQDKVELTRRNQELSLELERAQRGQEGFNDQVSDLHIELVGAKAQSNRQDQEKVQMKEELVMLKQVNEKLTAELGQTQHTLQRTLDELHQLQAEHKISTNLTAALEAERSQLLGEKELLMSTVEEHGESQSIQELRSSQAQLIEERDNLRTHCQNLQVSLEQAHEQLGSQIQEQQQLTLYWKERWQQTAVNLKSTEEQLEQAKALCSSTTNKHSEILQDYELLQTDAEELAELRMAISSLKKENSLLKEQIKEQEQNKHLQCLQSHIQANVDSPEDMNSKLGKLYKELQQAHERLKFLERERSEKELEIKKLKAESGSILRIELDACKQQLELERSRTATLQAKISVMDSRNKMEVASSQDRVDSLQNHSLSLLSERLTSDELSSEIENLRQQLEEERDAKKKKEELIFNLKEELDDLKHKKPGEIKASLEEVDSELMFVREELQKVWEMLKTKDTELEEQYQELESARGQYTECSTEKMRLEQVLATLQQQLTEKEQTMKHLKQMREMEKTEMDIERSSLQLKLAELQGQKGDVTTQAGQPIEETGPKWWRSKGMKVVESSKKCIRCEAFLQQLDETIKGCQEHNAELQEEKNQTLASLYQLQEVLTNLSKQSKVNEHVAQSLQADNDSLKKQHRLVTEQLKCLFKEKESLGKAYHKLPKKDKPTEDWNVQSRLVKNMLSSIKSHKNQQEELTEEAGHQPMEFDAVQMETNERDMRNLQRQLEEKSEQILKMASEMKLLQEKNESLMKAKMRFQQQVQQIRSMPHLSHQREKTDPTVPPLSGDINTSFHKKNEFLAAESQDCSGRMQGTPTSFQSASEGSWTSSPQNSRPPTPINQKVMPSASLLRVQLPGTVGKHWVKSKVESPLSPRSLADSEGNSDTPGSVTPRTSALLSPRPFHSPKSAQAFRYGKNVQHTNS
ncbi:hypothetical protein XENTR_v10009053 [Xenopus tropicalis]|uniref:Myosin-11 isoform X1 n=1 Tax=Xenopus tropicalis TaxID=8364 RepID=A0A8J0QVG2_XENTR|nr:myosin-11 isoform X1 [Xenopus tropicalis]KAE8617373.1 hypothetical protein XENTR_v10009053 [Xenopus tropicalis]KAE8617374.1 hypothetical protein XENTR_v10009053 [Xenopus tropicalis]